MKGLGEQDLTAMSEEPEHLTNFWSITYHLNRWACSHLKTIQGQFEPT